MRFVDSLVNLVSGLGGSKDKQIAMRYTLRQLDPAELENAYRGDWIARKIVCIPAQDATREWRVWQAEADQITKIEELERKFSLQNKVRCAMEKARLFGVAYIVIGVDGDQEKEINLDSVREGGLKYLHVVDRYELSPAEINRDLLSPYYDQPIYYNASSASGAVKLHPSRVVRFIGADMPSNRYNADGAGDSVLQAVDDAVKQAGGATAGVATLINEASVDIIRVPDFMANIGTADYRARMLERFTLANTSKSMVNALILDKEEEWNKVQVNFSNLPEVIKTYLNIVAGACDIPAVRFLGQSPTGLNATGDSDIRNYYDNISSLQKNRMQNDMTIMDEVLIRSALGSRPEEIHYKWRSLWQVSDTEKATNFNTRCTGVATIYNTGLVPSEALATATQNMLIEDGTLPGLEQAIDESSEIEINEGDPEVIAQFGAAEKPQDLAMNGAQITSLQGIVEGVANKQLPPETAIQLIMVGFPSITEEKARLIIDPAAAFTPAVVEQPSGFGQ